MSSSLLKALLTQEAHPKTVNSGTTLVPLPTFKIEIICRVCFKGFSSGYFSLSLPSGFDTLASIKKVLKHVIPEMKMNLINDSCICCKCWKIVSTFYKLKLQCLHNEQNFYQFLEKNGDTGDINVFLKQEADDEVENKTVFSDEIENTTVLSDEIENETVFSLNQSDPLAVEPDLHGEEQITIIDDSSDVETIILNEIPNNNEQNVEKTKTSNKKLAEQEDKTLSCSLCLTECRNFKEALQHASESHGVFAINCCNYCTTFVMDSESLIKHLLDTHNKDFSCPCGKTFISRQLLSKHLKNNPECADLKKQEKFKCPYCELVFEEKRLLNKHKRIHKRRLYTCEICGKSHANNQLLEEHRYIHSDIKRFMCEKCGKCFKQRSVLWIHNYKYHINIRTKQCPHCPKKFFTKSHLKKHQIVHTKEKNYECHICSRRFTTPLSVKRHMVIHTGEKFRCNKCGLTYSQIYPLKKHLCIPTNTTIEGDKPEDGGVSISIVKVPRKERSQRFQGQGNATVTSDDKCEICNRVYKKEYLRYHMRQHTGEKPEVCKICGKAFAAPASLGRHMMTHTGRRPFKCEKCDRSFIQKGDCEAHMRRKHTGERPYECKDCNKNFVEFSQLHKHRKSQAHLLAVECAGK